MHTTFFPDATRGKLNHGWLDTKHSFSFAGFRNPDRLGFGHLLVLNDDTVAPGRGFGEHPHRDMEILSIVLAGQLAHRDSSGNVGIIAQDQAQYMSAGTGVFHSEYNGSDAEPVHFLQIWVLPDQKGYAPDYAEGDFPAANRQGQWQYYISANGEVGAMRMRQRAYIARAELQPDQPLTYHLHGADLVAYFHVLKGQVKIGEQLLQAGDALGVSEAEEVPLLASKTSDVLVLETPAGTPRS